MMVYLFLRNWVYKALKPELELSTEIDTGINMSLKSIIVLKTRIKTSDVGWLICRDMISIRMKFIKSYIDCSGIAV